MHRLRSSVSSFICARHITVPIKSDVTQDPAIAPAHRSMMYELQQALRKGMQPVTTITTLLTDECRNTIGECGGLTGVVRRYPTHLVIRRNDQGVNFLDPLPPMMFARGVLLQEMLALIRRHSTGFVLVDDLGHQLSDEMKSLARREGGIRRIAQAHPTLFVLRDMHIGIVDSVRTAAGVLTTAAVPPAPPAHEIVEGLDPLTARIFFVLARHVPFNSFIPVAALIECLTPQETQILCASSHPEAIVRAMGELPPTLIDIRVLGEGLSATFVRLVGDGVPVTNAAVEQGEQKFAAMAAAPVGPLLAQHITDVVSVMELDTVLPPVVLEQLPLKGYECILLFDRLQHLFDVDLQSYRVRPKQSPHVFTFSTTPTPRALRHALTVLQKSPMTAEQLQNALPAGIVQEIVLVWKSLGQFVDSHPSLMFLIDGLVTLPSHRRTSSAVFEDNPKAIIDLVYENLPTDRAVPWVSLLKVIPPQALETRIMRDPRDFFSRYPDMFSLYDPCWVVGWLIARKGVPQPDAVHPPVHNIHDVLKQLAKASIGGSDESTIMNMMSRDAREVIKSVGLENLVQQLPEWFDVVNPTQTQGQAVLTYIGHLRGPPQTRTDPVMVLSRGITKR